MLGEGMVMGVRSRIYVISCSFLRMQIRVDEQMYCIFPRMLLIMSKQFIGGDIAGCFININDLRDHINSLTACQWSFIPDYL